MYWEVKPTRMELMEIRRRIKLSETGWKLLKMKRDGLIIEFFNILMKARDIRKQITEDYKTAEEKLNIAKCVDGSIAVNSAAFATVQQIKVNVTYKNVMGVIVPLVSSTSARRDIGRRGYGITTSVRIDEAADAFEKLVEDIIIAAELETTIKKLIAEIEKVKRRVNALEYRVIPTLKEIENFIRLRLEEMERENIFRLKMIKKE